MKRRGHRRHPPPPCPGTPKVRKTTVRRAHVLRQARAWPPLRPLPFQRLPGGRGGPSACGRHAFQYIPPAAPQVPRMTQPSANPPLCPVCGFTQRGHTCCLVTAHPILMAGTEAVNLLSAPFPAGGHHLHRDHGRRCAPGPEEDGTGRGGWARKRAEGRTSVSDGRGQTSPGPHYWSGPPGGGGGRKPGIYGGLQCFWPPAPTLCKVV